MCHTLLQHIKSSLHLKTDSSTQTKEEFINPDAHVLIFCVYVFRDLKLQVYTTCKSLKSNFCGTLSN